MNVLQPPRPLHSFREFIPDPELPALHQNQIDQQNVVRLGILCEHCTCIKEQITKAADLERERPSKLEQEYRHHNSGAKLEASFRAGCHLCTHLWHSFFNGHLEGPSPGYLPVMSRDDGRAVGSRDEKQALMHGRLMSSGPITVVLKRVTIYELSSFHSELTLQARARGSATRRWRACGDLLTLGGWRRRGEPLATASLRTSTSLASCRIKESIQHCVKFHWYCRLPRRQIRLPRRLLRVFVQEPCSGDMANPDAGNIMVQLLEACNIPYVSDKRYAALSYCWGPSGLSGEPSGSCFKLTGQTHHALRSGIPIAQLPKTLQHAAYSTLKLGLQYLWIDSLCILQDSPDDWASESESMGDVYTGAFITLAALGASHNDEGLFAQRDPLMYAPCPLVVRPGDGHVKLYVYPTGRKADQYLSTDSHPLYKRGWVFQERLLSIRTLRFGPILSWECRQDLDDEFSFEKAPEDHPMCGYFAKSLIGNTLPGGASGDGRHDDLYEYWCRTILQQFSGGTLTVPTDRLHAIKGVISIMEVATGWKSVSGLWLPFIARELLWQRKPEEHVRASKNRGRTGLRPSWSWISVEGEIAPYYSLVPVVDLISAEVAQPLEAAITGSYSLCSPESTKGITPALKLSCLALPLARTIFSFLKAEKMEYASTTGCTIPILRDLQLSDGEDVVEEFEFDCELALPIPEGNAFPDSGSTVFPEFFLPVSISTAQWATKPVPSFDVAGLGIAASREFPGCYQRVGVGKWTAPFTPEQLRERCIGPDSMDRKTIILV